MTHVKVKFDVPYCLMAQKIEYNGDLCAVGSTCLFLSGNDICKYLRFQHVEFEDDVTRYEFREHPDPEPGLTLYIGKIPLDLINYLEIDDRVLIDYEERVTMTND